MTKPDGIEPYKTGPKFINPRNISNETACELAGEGALNGDYGQVNTEFEEEQGDNRPDREKGVDH